MRVAAASSAAPLRPKSRGTEMVMRSSPHAPHGFAGCAVAPHDFSRAGKLLPRLRLLSTMHPDARGKMNSLPENAAAAARMTAPRGTSAEVFAVFLRLGLTSFGGPIAHLGYFHDEFVVRRKWLDEKTYADLVALSQFLPGPASTKVGIAIGLSRAGYAGTFAAWLGFTLPSAVALVLFGYGVGALGGVLHSGWLHGLMVAAVAVVA